jgi:hypothetical protein
MRRVTTAPARLTRGQRQVLARDGYLVLSGLLDDQHLAPIRKRLDELVSENVAGWDRDPPSQLVEAGVVHADLDPHDPLFRACSEHRMLADAASAALGPARHPHDLTLRAPLAGFGHQGLHPDFEHRQPRGRWQSLSAMWCITAFTAAGGALRVIPGSHHRGADPTDILPFGSRMGPHPDEVILVAPAGSVILFTAADLWHSGTHNYTPQPRLAVTAGFRPGSPVTRSTVGRVRGGAWRAGRRPSSRVCVGPGRGDEH